MLPTPITLDGKIFSKTIQRPTSSVYSNASAPLDAPQTFSVSHETLKSGRVNSVIVFVDDKVMACDPAACVTQSSMSPVRAQFKISYNPVEGRDDLTTAIEQLYAEMFLFLGDSTNWAAFLNKES